MENAHYPVKGGDVIKQVRRFYFQKVTVPLLAKRCDAILASFPKSGRTWFRFLLSDYFNRVFALGVRLDLHTTFSIVPNLDLDAVRGISAFRFDPARKAPPLVAVTDLPYDRRSFGEVPVVFMVRDPRDVLVSAYHHATKHKHRFNGGMGTFIRDDQQGLPSLLRYADGWSVGLVRPQRHVIHYERLSADAFGETVKFLSFLKVPIDKGALRQAVETATFANMREIELATGIPGHNYNRSDEQSLCMRKGKVGGFAQELDAKDLHFINEAIKFKFVGDIYDAYRGSQFRSY